LIASNRYYNIISKETKKVSSDQSEIDDLVQAVENLQISIDTVRTRLQRVVQRQQDTETADSEASLYSGLNNTSNSDQTHQEDVNFTFVQDKDPQIASKQAQSPTHKWNYSIGDTVKITNKLKIGGVTISEKYRQGNILYFTDRFIVTNIRYKVFGVWKRKPINREPPNVELVEKYYHA